MEDFQSSAKSIAELAAQVEGMRSVFEEANIVREEQRKYLDSRHDEVMLKLKLVREEINQETWKFAGILDSFERKSEFQLAEQKKELLDILDDNFRRANEKINSIEMTQKELEKGLADEIDQRKKQMEKLVGGLRDQLKLLTEQMNTEVKIRKTMGDDLEKELIDKNRALEDLLAFERAQRDTMTVALKKQLDEDFGRTQRRHLRIERFTNNLVSELMFAISNEAKLRDSTQKSIVDSVTDFVQKFKINLEAEMKGSN